LKNSKKISKTGNNMNNTININSKSRSFQPRFSIKRLFRNLDRVQDVLVVICAILLVLKMMLLLVDSFLSLHEGVDFKTVASQSLFILVLVELFRLLAVYLEHHRIYVGIAVEVAAVSILREIIVEGLFHMPPLQILAICSLLFVLGGLMFISHKVEGNVEH
jgi:uncharacterized membrane protein (DUF373 family)